MRQGERARALSFSSLFFSISPPSPRLFIFLDVEEKQQQPQHQQQQRQQQQQQPDICMYLVYMKLPSSRNRKMEEEEGREHAEDEEYGPRQDDKV